MSAQETLKNNQQELPGYKLLDVEARTAQGSIENWEKREIVGAQVEEAIFCLAVGERLPSLLEYKFKGAGISQYKDAYSLLSDLDPSADWEAEVGTERFKLEESYKASTSPMQKGILEKRLGGLRILDGLFFRVDGRIAEGDDEGLVAPDSSKYATPKEYLDASVELRREHRKSGKHTEGRNNVIKTIKQEHNERATGLQVKEKMYGRQ